jgi:threonine/homoserine/homoserine lactone efflux protein
MSLDLAWFGAASMFCAATALTPGPNNTMLMNSGASWGLKRSLPHMTGVIIGFPVMMATLALGGYPLLSNPTIHLGLKWIGAAYLLWLAWHIARAEPPTPGDVAAERPGPKGRPLSFVRAAVFQWLNPKAWVSIAGALAAFTKAGGAGVVRTALVLVLIAAVATLVSVVCWTLMGIGVSRVLRSPRALKRFNLVMGCVLALSVLAILVE